MHLNYTNDPFTLYKKQKQQKIEHHRTLWTTTENPARTTETLAVRLSLCNIRCSFFSVLLICCMFRGSGIPGFNTC